MRAFPLAQQADGINLLRQKGGASPTGLFDLKNGWVSAKGTIDGRPGHTLAKTFPAGTIGVTTLDNAFHVFSAIPVVSIDPEVVVHTLRHPTGGAAGLLAIHQAFSYLSKLYVVAEFTDSVVQHYWLNTPTAWATLVAKELGSRVQPTAANGYYYANLSQDTTTPQWTANNTVIVGDVRQPTVNNGLKFSVTSVTGTAPIRTSNEEPTWPTVAGATVTERRYVTESQTDPGTSVPPAAPTTDPIPGSENDPLYPFHRGNDTP